MKVRIGFRAVCHRINAVMPHFLMTASWMLLTFWAINRVNPAMSFLDSTVSQIFEVIYACIGVVTALLALKQQRLLIVAGLTFAVCAAFSVFPADALIQHSRSPVHSNVFEHASLIAAVITLIFSFADIFVMRREAFRRFRSKEEIQENEAVDETEKAEAAEENEIIEEIEE